MPPTARPPVRARAASAVTAPEAASRTTRLRRLVMAVMRDVHAAMRGHDVWILTAGVTFYALLAGVPSLVVAVRVTAAVAGRGRVDSLAAAVGRALPSAQSPATVIVPFVHQAASAHWRAVIVALIPATVWGEGLRRGFGRVTLPSAPGGVAPAPPSRWEGWRARAAVLPLLLVSPVGLLAVLEVAPELARLIGGGGIGGTVLGFYIALNVDWIVVSLALVYFYRLLGPIRPGWKPLLAGSFFTGAFVSGFLQGFVIFLAIPVKLGSPFGGFTPVGAAVAISLWLWLFTALSILGYAITQALQRRWEPAAAG
jgi:membrane protein